MDTVDLVLAKLVGCLRLVVENDATALHKVANTTSLRSVCRQSTQLYLYDVLGGFSTHSSSLQRSHYCDD